LSRLKYTIGGFSGPSQMLKLGKKLEIGGRAGIYGLPGFCQHPFTRFRSCIPVLRARLRCQGEATQVIERGRGFGLDQGIFRRGLTDIFKELLDSAAVVYEVAQMQDTVEKDELFQFPSGGPFGLQASEFKIVRIARLGLKRQTGHKKTNQRHVSQQVAHRFISVASARFKSFQWRFLLPCITPLGAGSAARLLHFFWKRLTSGEEYECPRRQFYRLGKIANHS
jgi:hypothetical protein